MKVSFIFVIVFFILAGCGQMPSSPTPFYDEGCLKIEQSEIGANLTYYVRNPGRVFLGIADDNEIVVTLVDEDMEVGYHKIRWEYFVKEGELLPSGSYQAILQYEGLLETDKIDIP